LIIVQFLFDNKTKRIAEEVRYFNAFKIILDSKMKNKTYDEINLLLQGMNLKISDLDFNKLVDLKGEKIEENSPVEIYFIDEKKYAKIIDKPFMKPHFEERIDFFKPQLSIKDRFENKVDFQNPYSQNLDFIHEPKKPDEVIRNIILEDLITEKEFKYFWFIVLFIIDILLIWFLFFLQKKLKPLLVLKENMIKLSTGDFSISMRANGKDEISQVANEFENAVKQLKQLRESRNLFLRNIMHELKTPITKGKLVTDMYEESERKHILIRVFQRLEYLLSEFAKIEELTSGKITLKKDSYHAIDLIEQAFDILLLDNNKIDIEYENDLFLNVDFELFSIALKNLIDNAISYNTNGNPQIFIGADFIKIINKGEKLKKDIEDYYKPFNHDYEDASSGLGLGLYISNNIIKIHNFKLEYEYLNGYHNFVIKLN
jgi:two-component system, OmpR family, sensor kinase